MSTGFLNRDNTALSCLDGLVVKATASRAENPGFNSRLRSQSPGVIGSALGLVGSVSVYCDWVRWFDPQLFYLIVAAGKNCLSRSVPEIH